MASIADILAARRAKAASNSKPLIPDSDLPAIDLALYLFLLNPSALTRANNICLYEGLFSVLTLLGLPNSCQQDAIPDLPICINQYTAVRLAQVAYTVSAFLQFGSIHYTATWDTPMIHMTSSNIERRLFYLIHTYFNKTYTLP